MRILVVGTHPHVRQPSMTLFARWLVQAVTPLGRVDLTQAPAIFLTAARRRGRASKWLAYVDQYLLLTLRLWLMSRRYDVILVADQGNAPSAALTPRHKLAVMVHDTIAMRQALGQIVGAPATGRAGVLLQALIRRAVGRARLVLSNPGAIPGEIKRLGLAEAVHVVGCPADLTRLDSFSEARPVASPYVLNVAGDGWRKRKRDLIPLWKEVQTRGGPRLVMAGHTDDETLKAFEDAGVRIVTVLNDVGDQELATLYRHCAALISPSHEEGLCIPVLEALHFDKPVLLADLSPSYADFFGDAVIRLDFTEPAKAAKVLLCALSEPPNLAAIGSVKTWSQPAAFNRRVAEAFSEPPADRRSVC